jgi:hypothetical protein
MQLAKSSPDLFQVFPLGHPVAPVIEPLQWTKHKNG